MNIKTIIFALIILPIGILLTSCGNNAYSDNVTLNTASEEYFSQTVPTTLSTVQATNPLIPSSEITKPASENNTKENNNTELSDIFANLGGDDLNKYFISYSITKEIEKRIFGISYKENEKISLNDLKYINVLYYGFDGESHVGELIVNKGIADDIIDIFIELYELKYPIEKMVLVDEYNADDELSMSDNNSSAFNYRVIAGTDRLSNHAKGLAIDINPLYNPYVRTSKGKQLISPDNSADYADRSKNFEYKIQKGDDCYNAFIKRGFSWGGEWSSSKDYQHFEKVLK